MTTNNQSKKLAWDQRSEIMSKSGLIHPCRHVWLNPHFSLCGFLEERPDCSKARCEVQFSPRCPEDSVLIEGYAPPGECCPLPSRCVCSPAGCLRKVCQPGYLNILVSKSSGKPGECCDLYECKPGKSAGHIYLLAKNYSFMFSWPV